MQDVSTVVSFLKEMMLVTSGSFLIPTYTPWRERYKVRKTIIYSVIEKVSKQAKTVSAALYGAFNVYREKNEQFISSVLGEILATNANEEVLDRLLHLYASRSFSLDIYDAIHDGLIKRGAVVVPRMVTYIKDLLEEEKQQEANDLLSVLSKIRSEVAFDCLKRFYKDEQARRLLPNENLLKWFLNQGKGAEFLKNSAIMEKIPEQAASTIKKLENGTYPSKDSLFIRPKVERKSSDIAHGLQAVWKKDAKAMRACAACGKNTKSHLLPGNKVLCHKCWRQGKAIPYFNQAISKRRDEIEQKIDEKEMEIKLFQKIGEFYKNKQEVSKALTLYQQFLEKYPHNFSLLTTYASLFRAMGNKKREKAVYETMKKISPYNPETYKYLGSFYRRQEQYTKAISHFTHALQLTIDQREAFTNDIPIAEMKDTINNLTTLIEERVHSLPQGRPRKKDSIIETGLLPEEKKLFPQENQPKKDIYKVSTKLLEIKKLEREYDLDKKLQKGGKKWQTTIKKLSEQENPYLPLLKQMVTTYPTKQVLNELDKVLKELEKTSYLDTYLLLLIAKLSTPQAIPIQYTFMDFDRFGDWADDLIKPLSNQGTLCLKFLSIELKEGRVPIKKLPVVWNIMTNIDEKKSLKPLLKYVSHPIRPEKLQKEDWQYLLEDLTTISDPSVGHIFETLQENLEWFKPAYNIVNNHYNDWKHTNQPSSK